MERAIRYLRTSFYPLRSTWGLAELNRDVRLWCRERAMERRWPQDRRRTVREAYLEERSHLLPLPAEPFPCHEWIETAARRSPYVRFDANRYSIPHDRVGRALQIAAEVERVRIFDRHELIAAHRRSWDRGQRIEEPEHLAALERTKRQARRSREQDRLLRAVPSAEALLSALGRRQHRLGSAVSRLLEMLAEVGPRELEAAVAEALERGSPHPASVRFLLDRRRQSRGQPPAIAVELPDDPKVRDLVVTPHPLADYDSLDEDEQEETQR